jgi:hypothetical protein
MLLVKLVYTDLKLSNRLITGFMTRIAQRVLHVEQELITLTKHMSSLRFLVGFILLELQFSCCKTPSQAFNVPV